MKALLLVVLLGCAHAPPPRPPGIGATVEICLSEAPLPYVGSCGQRVTGDGHPCAVCAHDRACLDPTTFQYCTGAAACDDPLCVGAIK